MNTLRLQAQTMLSGVPDSMMAEVIDYLGKLQLISDRYSQPRQIDFSKYTRKGTIPLGMDAQEWVEELRSNDRI